MSEHQKPESDDTMDKGAESESRSTRDRMNEGFQKGLGILSAFKEAMEETIAEARERGDFSTDRAREAIRKAADRARNATSDARERFDFVGQQDFDELVRRVDALEARERSRRAPGETPPGEEGPA